MNADAAPQLAWELVVIGAVVCLGGSAFFSGAETGYMSVSRVRLRRLETTDIRAHHLRRQLEQLQDPIMTCLIGTNLFNVMFSALLTTAFTARYGQRGEGIAAAVAAVLVILFAEIVPKTLYREFPERLTLASVRPLQALMTATAPLRALLGSYSAFLQRLLPEQRGASASLDRANLTALLLTNALPETEDRRFRESLARFLELAGTDITRIMRPVDELVSVAPGITVGEARAVAARSGFSRLPLLAPQSRTPLGYILVRDLLFWTEDPDRPVPAALVRSFLLVDAAVTPYELFEELHAQGRQIALIVDRRGEALGLTTLEDLLEGIVGSIQDEFDVGALAPVGAMPSGTTPQEEEAR